MGNRIVVLTSGQVLTVVSPVPWLAVVMVLGFFGFLGLLRIMPGRDGGSALTKTPVFVFSAALLVFLGIVISPAKVEIDAGAGTVRVFQMLYYWPYHYSYPLTSVQGAYVAPSDQADALRLLFAGGGSLQLTPYNQMNGKGEAAYAINEFLRRHGGAGVP